MDSKNGRPELNNSQLDLLVRKMEPYLKRGLSVRKACQLANIPHSTVYDYLNKDQEFSDKIEAIKSYKANLVMDIISYRLEKVVRKVCTLRKLENTLASSNLPPNIKEKLQSKISDYELTKEEWKFIEWVALNDKGLSEYFSNTKDRNSSEKEPISSLLDKLEYPVNTDYGKISEQAKNELKLQGILV